ncbi:OmpA family protein [Flavobacterium sp.]|uniref:OmpA family protein n=1 Tax=Flavobacterium sp. TaxID=239 RepID=UPI000EE693F6|nr:OmpA family protein [Flavobacterium sp.]HCQ12325.1 cell envelope biogenesis protein OmpA [Flavobacterium sp.]
MKYLKLIILSIIGACGTMRSQTSEPISDKGLQFSIRAGLDKPLFNNNVPYVDYKIGLNLGVSLDYYWKWFGVGFDFDYLNNGAKNSYPLTNLFNSSGTQLTSFAVQENKITRMFYGFGPDFRYVSNSKKFQTELNTRIGFSSIKGGEVEVVETTTGSDQLLNYHAGYDLSSSLSAKAQLRFTYFFNNFGVHLGVYYLKHFDGTELYNATKGFSTGFAPFTTNQDGGIVADETFAFRKEPCDCDLASMGVFAGITFKFPKKVKEEKVCAQCVECTVCGKTHALPMCACQVCGCKLSITAKDKFTHEILPDTDVVLVNSSAQTINSGKTNGFGVVVFDNVKPDNYTIKGLLNTVSLEDGSIAKSEFASCQANNGVIAKEIIYSDRNFIIKGRAFECNSTIPIAGINVTLENKELAIKKSTMTDAQGNFLLQLPETGVFELYGRKESYFSQIERVTASNYNRDKNLFVQLEMCAEKVDCGKGLGLKNILFDLDKYVIKESAKPELNRLVRFMLDNPTVKVEVGSHTDCRSSHAYNKKLSQNRANASVDYVVSQGIERSRITGKGYGETVLLNECADGVKCLESQHDINRRTEMKVICPE